MKYTHYFTDLTHTGVGTQWVPRQGVNSYILPLGIGNVAAYASKNLPELMSMELFKFPEDLNNALKVKIPHFLSMSNLCFGLNLSYAFASYVKKKYSETVVIFGGPNFPTKPVERKKFLKKYPLIDFYIKWDGEVSYVSLVKKLMKYELDIKKFKKDKIISQNCCYLVDDEYIEGPDHRIQDLSEMPSPYTMGLMDKFFGQGLSPAYEITRGCPYSCTFCNSGHDFKSHITRKSLETIKQELEYIAKRTEKDVELVITDDNFGMYKEDVGICHVISDIIKKYHWPPYIDVARGKSQPERILETSEIINEHQNGTLRVGASLQSHDAEVLKNIKRKNLPLERLIAYTKSRQVKDSTNDFHSEFILGLPGDTIQKHYDSLRYAIDTLETSRIDIHQLNIFYGTEMHDPEHIEKYKMDIRYRVFVGAHGIYNIGDKQVPCSEINGISYGNNTLSFEETIECRIMNLLVKIFIDQDPFREVIGFVRRLNLSVFDLLITLKEKVVPKYSSLTKLIADFVEKTKKPLYKDLKELEAFLLRKENIEDFASGKLGENELLNFKSKALIECIDDLHKALKDSILLNLKKHNLLTSENEDYLNQATQFSYLRKFDIRNLNKIKYGEFTYDFIRASELGYQVDPNEMKIKKTKFKLSHDNKTLDYINKRIDLYGNKNHQIGKMLQRTNLEVMSRRISKINL